MARRTPLPTDVWRVVLAYSAEPHACARACRGAAAAAGSLGRPELARRPELAPLGWSDRVFYYHARGLVAPRPWGTTVPRQPWARARPVVFHAGWTWAAAARLRQLYGAVLAMPGGRLTVPRSAPRDDRAPEGASVAVGPWVVSLAPRRWQNGLFAHHAATLAPARDPPWRDGRLVERSAADAVSAFYQSELHSVTPTCAVVLCAGAGPSCLVPSIVVWWAPGAGLRARMATEAELAPGDPSASWAVPPRDADAAAPVAPFYADPAPA